jgi:hypothetical protein
MEQTGHWFHGLAAWLEPVLPEKNTKQCKKEPGEVYGAIGNWEFGCNAGCMQEKKNNNFKCCI